MNRLKHPKAQSAGTATTSKAQPTLTDTTNTATPHEDEVKVENISPDTSPAHHSTNKPSNVTVLDKTFNKTKQDGKDSENSQSIKRAESNREKDRIAQKKKEPEVTATAKKTAPVQKDKPKEPTGYAARYFQRRAAAADQHSTNTKLMDKEILTAGIIDVDRPLLSPATRESMARKRNKPITDDGSQNSSVTSISAPVRRTKPSSLTSGKTALWILCAYMFNCIFYVNDIVNSFGCVFNCIFTTSMTVY